MAAVNTVIATKLKATIVLDAGQLLTVEVVDGKPRVILRVKFPDRVLTADVAAKSVRKAQAMIREQGADSVVPLLQGMLTAGDVLPKRVCRPAQDTQGIGAR
jgi:hypothetical protein